jgi:hypothetical protein
VGMRLIARDTVAVETLARRAISRISIGNQLEHLSMARIRLLSLLACPPIFGVN